MKKSTLALWLLLFAFNSLATTVRFETNVGVIDIELYDADAPITVQNFLNYVNSGRYDGTAIHRSEPGFVIQGGGYIYDGGSQFTTVTTDAPITNESGISNTLGTIAMARTSDPNSATNQWFINLSNNPELNPSGSDEGYAVFGEVVRGLDVVKNIESYLRINFSSSNLGQAVNAFPVYGPFSGSAVTLNNVVQVNRAYELSDVFQINAGLSGAWFNPDTNGQGFYLEVLPSLDTIIMAWFTFDTEQPDGAVPSTIGASGNRWLTVAGQFDGNQFAGDIIKTSGGLFDDPTSVMLELAGSIAVRFDDCGHALMSYSLNESGLVNEFPLQRISGSNIEFCEELAIINAPGATVTE
ncbi:peptidylprolyl isomerase [Marinicella sediminis]|uniref:peptidylprolyl isomerase n=1 Tax=Marinicella sediminis TaxID=1792834 RepID=A0ABV7J8C7_9GAMM|nr:peptidylprolyl isomerase [Marinicella sediminis]